jgi:hypothetical protein
MGYRILVTVFLILSVLFLPYWLQGISFVGAAFYFSIYWEGLVVFLISDLIFAQITPKLFGILYASLIISIILLISIELLKKKLRYYP